MAARRSFQHTMGKFESPKVRKPVAIMTAWRGWLLGSFGQTPGEATRRLLNDRANRKLMANIQNRGLSFYPVVGAGQEQDSHGILSVCKENGLLVQPIGQMNEDDFIGHIQELLFDPTDEQGHGPFDHAQWGALVKVPSQTQAFTLSHSPPEPTGPEDYTLVQALGNTAEPRRNGEPWYTQMRYGPRAEPAMMDSLDQPDDVGNPRPGTRRVGSGLPGMRFFITNRSRP